MWFWAVGVVFQLTAAVRWCPRYRLFGVKNSEGRRKG
ncbi:MAG: DUF2892 domain-containing protein [Flavobacteriales bacterium]